MSQKSAVSCLDFKPDASQSIPGRVQKLVLLWARPDGNDPKVRHLELFDSGILHFFLQNDGHVVQYFQCWLKKQSNLLS